MRWLKLPDVGIKRAGRAIPKRQTKSRDAWKSVAGYVLVFVSVFAFSRAVFWVIEANEFRKVGAQYCADASFAYNRRCESRYASSTCMDEAHLSDGCPGIGGVPELTVAPLDRALIELPEEATEPEYEGV